MVYKDVIDIFIFKSDRKRAGEGGYSMYVMCEAGILLYEGIDKKDNSTVQMTPLSNELQNVKLAPGTMDCNAMGQILFDIKNINNQHQLKSFMKTKSIEKYDFQLDGEKKIIKFFNQYVIEVKTERGQDKIQIYDFDNKLILFNASYQEITQVEVEMDDPKPGNEGPSARSVYMQVKEKTGKQAVYQLTERGAPDRQVCQVPGRDHC